MTPPLKLYPEAEALLKKAGFEECGPCPMDRRKTQYLRNTSVRGIHISLENEANIEDVVDAIFDAGREHHRAHSEGQFNSFLRSLRVCVDLPPLIPKPKPVIPSEQ